MECQYVGDMWHVIYIKSCYVAYGVIVSVNR